MKDEPQRIDAAELHMYFALALERHGIANAADDLVVKENDECLRTNCLCHYRFRRLGASSQEVPFAFRASPYRVGPWRVGYA